MTALSRRFATNLGRVRNLLVCHDVLRSTATPDSDDVLRAAVVLLHATLEDLLREAESKVLRADPRSCAKNLKLPDGPESFTMVDLLGFRENAVSEVFDQAVTQYVDQRTYNNATQIAGALRSIGLRTDPWFRDRHAAQLDSMTKRRHAIAHRADQGPVDSLGGAIPSPISPAHIAPWLTAVEDVGQRVIDHLSTPGTPNDR